MHLGRNLIAKLVATILGVTFAITMQGGMASNQRKMQCYLVSMRPMYKTS